MDELCVGRIRRDGGNGFDLDLAHDDRVALHMAEAPAVADDHGVEDLLRFILRDGAGNDAAARIFTVEFDLHVALGVLLAVGEQALRDDSLGVLAADDLRLAHGGVDAADLYGFHLDARAFVKVDDGGGVHHACAAAVALAIVLFYVTHVGVFGDIERVDAVVAALVAAGVVDAAGCADLQTANCQCRGSRGTPLAFAWGVQGGILSRERMPPLFCAATGGEPQRPPCAASLFHAMIFSQKKRK